MHYAKHILVCTTAKENHCGLKGGEELFHAFKTAAAKHPELLVSRGGCTHQHSVGPIVIVHPDGVWYKEVQLSDIDEILEAAQNNRVVERLLNREISVG